MKKFVLTFITLVLLAETCLANNWNRHKVTDHSFAVKLDPETDAYSVALSLEMINHGVIGALANWFHFEAPFQINSRRESSTSRIEHIERSATKLKDHPGVLYAEYQIKSIVKPLWNLPTDPNFPDQWHLQNTGQYGFYLPGADINVVPAWLSGYTGKGVLMQFNDDGLDWKLPEFSPRYFPEASADWIDNDDDPSPEVGTGTHGTFCAGLAAAQSNNGDCGTGVAYDAKLAAIRWLGTPRSPIEKAELFGPIAIFNNVDISSNSWGDSGLQFSHQSQLLFDALQEATISGRKGRGLIITFSAGNSGLEGESNLEAGKATPFTILVGAIGPDGKIASYSEHSAAVFVSAPGGLIPAYYPNGYPQDGSLNLNASLTGVCSVIGDPMQCPPDTCQRETIPDGGTSYANPIVAGAIALALEANSRLTYRDIMHLLVRTSKPTNLDDEGWQINGAGFFHHHQYGFGLVNAARLVDAAKSWKSAGPLRTALFSDIISSKSSLIPTVLTGSSLNRTITIPAHYSGSVEHALVYVSIDHPRANQLGMTLISPSGMKSELTRPHSTTGLGCEFTFDLDQANIYQEYLTVYPFSWLGQFDGSDRPFSTTGMVVLTYDMQCKVVGPPLPMLNSPVACFLFYNASVQHCGFSSYPITESLTIYGASVLIFDKQVFLSSPPNSAAVAFQNPSQTLLKFVQYLYQQYRSSDNPEFLYSHNFAVDLSPEPYDTSSKYLLDYYFTSVRHWGESPVGEWVLQLQDDIVDSNNGVIFEWHLELYGVVSSASSQSNLLIFAFCLFLIGVIF